MVDVQLGDSQSCPTRRQPDYPDADGEFHAPILNSYPDQRLRQLEGPLLFDGSIYDDVSDGGLNVLNVRAQLDTVTSHRPPGEPGNRMAHVKLSRDRLANDAPSKSLGYRVSPQARRRLIPSFRNRNNLAAHESDGRSTFANTERRGGPRREVTEAAFVICQPSKQRTPISSPRVVDHEWNEGCVVSVSDSNLADEWVDKHYDHALLVRIRDEEIRGPFPSMLSVESAALAIFGIISVSLIKVAKELADLSGFPVIVRPQEDDPSQFRNRGHGFSEHTADSDQAGGATSTQSGSHGMTPVDSEVQRVQNEEHSDSEEESDGAPPLPLSLDSLPLPDKDTSQDIHQTQLAGAPPPPPPPPPLPINKAKKIVHETDIQLILSNSNIKGNRSLRIVTKAKLYPPNPLVEREIDSLEFDEPYIEGHIGLYVTSGHSVNIDNTLGSVGFLTTDMNDIHYLFTERLISLGYGEPQQKLNHTMGNQYSKVSGATVGVAAGQPTASFNAMVGKVTSSAIEVADDEVAKKWVVSDQNAICNWTTQTSSYCGRNTMIRPYQNPAGADTHNLTAKYGLLVEVSTPLSEIPHVGFLYRHQIHCWVPVESKSMVRGLIVLISHFIPDIREERPLRIKTQKTLETVIQGSSEDNGVCPKTNIANEVRAPPLLPNDHFVLSIAKLPLEHMARLGQWVKTMTRNRKKQKVKLPLSPLVTHGWNRIPLGWDDSNLRWFYPIWPDLDERLDVAPDRSKAKWKLDWEDRGGHESES